MAIQAVIFDADGMIVMHEPRFSTRLADEYGITLETTKAFFTGPFQDCVVGKADLKDELAKFLEGWGWNKGVDAFMALWFLPEGNKIDERIKTVIEQLRAKGIKTYLATNNEKYRTRNLTEERGLGAWFDTVFASSSVGAKKPERAFFQHIIDTTGHTKEGVMFWDDDIINVQGAEQAGLRACQYATFDDFKKTLNQEGAL